jgi:hypothetical protein
VEYKKTVSFLHHINVWKTIWTLCLIEMNL